MTGPTDTDKSTLEDELGKLDATATRIADERNRYREALIAIGRQVDTCKIWGGMGWRYLLMVPPRVEKIHRIIDEALERCGRAAGAASASQEPPLVTSTDESNLVKPEKPMEPDDGLCHCRGKGSTYPLGATGAWLADVYRRYHPEQTEMIAYLDKFREATFCLGCGRRRESR